MYKEVATNTTATNYVSPQLLFIGKLENLTTGGSGSKRESTVSGKGKGKGKGSSSQSSSRRP